MNGLGLLWRWSIASAVASLVACAEKDADSSAVTSTESRDSVAWPVTGTTTTSDTSPRTATTTDSGTISPCGRSIAVDLGIGHTGHEPLHSDDEFVVSSTPGGQWGIVLSGQIVGSGPTVELGYGIYSSTFDEDLGSNTWVLSLVDYNETECTGVFFAQWAMFSARVPPEFDSWYDFLCAIADTPLDVSAEVRDWNTGATGFESVTRRAVIDPDDQWICQ